MNIITAQALSDPFISLKTLSEWTGQSVGTLRNEWKRQRLEVTAFAAVPARSHERSEKIRVAARRKGGRMTSTETRKAALCKGGSQVNAPIPKSGGLNLLRPAGSVNGLGWDHEQAT